MSVCRVDGKAAVGRIPATVEAVGYDQRYIVAQQRSSAKPAQTSFYYLQMAKDEVVGPLGADEFAQKKAELSLPEFNHVITRPR
jgi:hypothetical protein